VFTNVTSSRDSRPGSASASSTRTAAPPHESGANNSKTERSKQIEVEKRTPRNSSREKTPCAQRRRVQALACVMATPLGLPVEPDV
jgi:hypothetical protein